jgi:dienelactone hydrolase
MQPSARTSRVDVWAVWQGRQRGNGRPMAFSLRRLMLGIGSLCVWQLAALSSWGQSPADYLTFIRSEAARLRSVDWAPVTAAEWQARREVLRTRLEQAWGGFPAERCPLEPRMIGTIPRDGYRIDKLLLQTMPGVWMTALAYVPEGSGPFPAILNVHGHWKHAKLEPVVQSRCIGAAKLGFLVLAVDAFGAGERAIGTALGEYHGEMAGATLLPIGRPLSGIQVYENMRAVDYLQSRRDVIADRIGVTGASGGGNQSMYAGAWDERLAAAVPVCSVGNYMAYLGAACCLCEVVPGAMQFTEEADVLALTAPRGLMPINATRDALQFSIREARKSLVNTQHVYDLLGVSDHVYHTTFHWHHDYSQAMREAMYGWMTKHLKQTGDGAPIAEPAHETLPVEELRLFPGDSRPADWLTMPQFAAQEARSLLARPVAMHEPEAQRTILRNQLLGGEPALVPLESVVTRHTEGSRLTFVSEPGIRLALRGVSQPVDWMQSPTNGVAILVDLAGALATRESTYAPALQERGMLAITLDLRTRGELAQPGDKIGRAPDHNTAEWGLWIGRPLLGQWAWDLRRAVAAVHAQWPDLPRDQLTIITHGPAGLVGLTANALDPMFPRLVIDHGVVSYVTDQPYEGFYLGLIVPGILRDFGDIPTLAGLAHSQMTLVGGVNAVGQPVPFSELQSAFVTPAAARPTQVRNSTTPAMTVIDELNR